jgi:hypothetical protein
MGGLPFYSRRIIFSQFVLSSSFIWLASVSNNLQLKNGIVPFAPKTKVFFLVQRQAHGREEGSREFRMLTVSRVLATR